MVVSTIRSTHPISIIWQHEGVTIDTNSSEVILHAPVTVERNGTALIKSILELCLTELDEGSQYSCMVMQQELVHDEGMFSVAVEPRKCNQCCRGAT